MNEDLEKPPKINNFGRPFKQNSTPKKIECPKQGQIIECKLTNGADSEWRKLNLISTSGISTVKNKHLMNVLVV